MPAKVNDLDRCLCGKLKANREEGKRHTTYYIYDGETLLARTELPRSFSELDNSLFSTIARQLHVGPAQLRQLLACPMSRDQFVAHVKGS